MEIKIIHNECLKFLSRDLNNNDMDALERHIGEVGLDVLLDFDFLHLLRRLGDHQLVLLIASLGSTNTQNPAPFTRWLAAYQYLGRIVTAAEAATFCEAAGYANRDFHLKLFEAGSDKHQGSMDQTSLVCIDDLEFGIDFLIDAHQPERVVPLVKSWSKLDVSASPWLKASKKIVERQETTQTRSLAIKMATALEKLIAIAPKGHDEVVEKLYAQTAEFWIKARKGVESTAATVKFQRRQTSYSPTGNYLELRSRLLMKDLPGAIACASDLMKHLAHDDISVTEEKVNEHAKALDFDPEAAADTLRCVNAALRRKGLQPFLMSGTLLGYLRDGNILPHDKDVDIGIIGWEHQFDVAQALVELGHFHINFDELKGDKLFLFAPKDFRNRVAIDVFFYHDRGDHFLHGIDFQYGYTENFRFSKFQLKEVDFLGEKFWIPEDPARKLRENYGDWETPLPGYVVSVESPGICDKGGLPHRVSAHLELLKAMTTKKSHEKVRRILNYCNTSGHALISDELHQTLNEWLLKETAEATTC